MFSLVALKKKYVYFECTLRKPETFYVPTRFYCRLLSGHSGLWGSIAAYYHNNKVRVSMQPFHAAFPNHVYLGQTILGASRNATASFTMWCNKRFDCLSF
jgi:hypothetical protein